MTFHCLPFYPLLLFRISSAVLLTLGAGSQLCGAEPLQPQKKVISTTFAEGVFSSNQLKSILPSTNRRGQPQTAHQVKKQSFQMPGFRARWWNYAKRGYWHLEHDRPTEALEDFNTALSIKPHDQWTARTYGLHFEEYFAQRGKGIALLELKQYDESIQALNLSIADATSEKALYFLRKAKLEKRLDVEKDRHPPEISITAKRVLVQKYEDLNFTDEICPNAS